MTLAPTPTKNPTDALVTQVIRIDGSRAILTENNRVLKYQVPRTEIWLEQRIWGHRLYNDQTPWLLLLEALNVMAAYAVDANRETIFPGLGSLHENESYGMHRRKELRQLLFRDRDLDEIAAIQSIADASQWSAWFNRSPDGSERFGYLRDRFVTFNALRNAVALLRGAEIESERHRRPTSRHIAPRGIDMLVADFGESRSDGVNKDRRFFARGGELLYLMLNRSRLHKSLDGLVRRRLVGANSRWNKLAKALQPGTPEPLIVMDTFGYLPLAEHPAYERIAEDWHALLSLEGLPDDSLPEPLMRLSGLGVMQYIVDRGADVLGDRRPVYAIDMLGTETANVQKLSKDCFARHKELSRKAIKKLVQALANSQEWKAAQSKANPEQALKDLCKKAFDYSPTARQPESMTEEIANVALENHDQHLGRVVGFYADQIGMAVARRGNGRWYAASDGMLEALVLANVTAPMEFEGFLDKLWERYGFVIGTDAARREFAEGNYEHFRSNQRLFEDRLRILGLSKRLSDDCAFVINPFHRQTEGTL